MRLNNASETVRSTVPPPELGADAKLIHGCSVTIDVEQPAGTDSVIAALPPWAVNTTVVGATIATHSAVVPAEPYPVLHVSGPAPPSPDVAEGAETTVTGT